MPTLLQISITYYKISFFLIIQLFIGIILDIIIFFIIICFYLFIKCMAITVCIFIFCSLFILTWSTRPTLSSFVFTWKSKKKGFKLNMNKNEGCRIGQRRLDPGKETRKGFFQVWNHKEYQNVVIISFVHLEKINIFCFMHKGVAQKLSLSCPLEN